jgi:succinyl-diaminopimelate desuccinylase
MLKESIKLTSELIEIESITPDIKCVEFIYQKLKSLGFECDFVVFEDTANLYAKIGTGENLCFAGHCDVVPIIDEKKWSHNPFKAKIKDEKIWGRGAVDMKSAIAAFITAYEFFAQHNQIEKFIKNRQISLLITGDEEGTGRNGTAKMLEYLDKKYKNFKIDYCLIGEPTGLNQQLDSIHIGRRGSMNFNIEITGKEGHVAYPENFKNPITAAVKICDSLKLETLDHNADKIYDASNLEIIEINANNNADNIIPIHVKFRGNIRFNPNSTIESLVEKINHICKNICTELGVEYSLTYRSTHRGYRSDYSQFVLCVENIVKEITGTKPTITTRGGVTDGSFIIKYCKNICELGASESKMHKIDENIEISEVNKITESYYKIIESFLVSQSF